MRDEVSRNRGLFVGLVTLDLIYRVERLPGSNQKIVASDYGVSAGGPATNAAVAFGHLENEARVIAALGNHPMTHLILADLQECSVNLVDLMPDRSDPPPISSIFVTEATGDRAVVSINAVKTQAAVEAIPTDCLRDVDIVLIDGHQMVVGQAIAQQAKERKIPVVMDGGSWKAGLDQVLPLVDYALCSANFRPPGCSTEAEVIQYLADSGIPQIAMTHGEQPIQYWSRGQTGLVEVPVIKAVDTLGAGDFFHGAFCQAILQEDFVSALAFAAGVAAYSCQFFGSRRWLEG